MTKSFTYKSYVFVDKDPIIDEIRTVVQDAGVTYKHIEEHSGVTAHTLRAWFGGATRRPQAATVNAVLRSLGWKLGVVPYEVVPLIQPTSAPRSGRSVSHVVRMAKIRRVK